ncbi:hypothetical protein [Mycolicibacterium sp.]|uniref:hypothetical protein n=1 Tax=Mycolicibacterium sp. TaxID=2320850 RepID=UPI0037C6C2C0
MAGDTAVERDQATLHLLVPELWALAADTSERAPRLDTPAEDPSERVPPLAAARLILNEALPAPRTRLTARISIMANLVEEAANRDSSGAMRAVLTRRLSASNTRRER